MMRERLGGLLVGIWLVGVGLFGQLIYHLPNFAPVAAAALFAGFYYRRPWAAAAVPLATLVLSDVLVDPVVGIAEWLLGPAAASWLNTAWATSYHPRVMVVVMLGLSLPVLLGMWLQTPLSARYSRRPLVRWLARVGQVAGCSLSSSLAFFLTSNFAVWFFGSEAWYPKTLAGLASCYAAALPFLKYTVGGDLFYSGLFFGAYAAVHSLAMRWSSLAVARLPASADSV